MQNNSSCMDTKLSYLSWETWDIKRGSNEDPTKDKLRLQTIIDAIVLSIVQTFAACWLREFVFSLTTIFWKTLREIFQGISKPIILYLSHRLEWFIQIGMTP